MEIYYESVTGSVRTENQDNAIALRPDEDVVCAVVCDGMGGANAGSFASKKAVDILKDRITSGFRPGINEKSIKNLLTGAVRTANAVLYEISEEDYEKHGMGTTCVAVMRRDNKIFCVNAGDSRAYIINDKITRITKDHSLVMELYESGEITFEEMMTHPQRNYLTRAVGVQETLSTDYFELEISEGDIIMLCSDGLSGVCSDEEILEEAKKSPPEEIPKALVNLALESGSRDNITVAVII